MASRSWIAGLALGLFLTACATTTEIDRRFLGVVTHVDPASRHVTLRELRPDGTTRETRVIVNSLTRIQGPGGPAGLGGCRRIRAELGLGVPRQRPARDPVLIPAQI